MLFWRYVRAGEVRDWVGVLGRGDGRGYNFAKTPFKAAKEPERRAGRSHDFDVLLDFVSVFVGWGDLGCCDGNGAWTGGAMVDLRWMRSWGCCCCCCSWSG